MNITQIINQAKDAVLYTGLGVVCAVFIMNRLWHIPTFQTNTYFFNGNTYSDAYQLFDDIEKFGAKKSLYRMEFAYEDYLYTLPDALKKYNDLITILSVVHGSVTTIPDWISVLTKLEYMQIQDQRITALPPELGNLRMVKKLKIGGNSLTYLPESIGELSALEVLDCYDNKISVLPDSIGKLQNLRVMDVSSNNLASFPTSLGNLKNLQTLYVGGNPLSEEDLKNLKTLLPNTTIIF